MPGRYNYPTILSMRFYDKVNNNINTVIIIHHSDAKESRVNQLWEPRNQCHILPLKSQLLCRCFAFALHNCTTTAKKAKKTKKDIDVTQQHSTHAVQSKNVEMHSTTLQRSNAQNVSTPKLNLKHSRSSKASNGSLETLAVQQSGMN